MSSQKNIPKLRFPEFRDAGVWRESKLENILELLSGYAFKSEYFSENGKKLLTPKNFTKDGNANFSKENTKFTTEECDSRYVCKEGDLLLLLTDLTPSCELLGMPIFIKKEDGESLLNQRIVKVIPTKETSINFLLFFFLTNSYRKRIKNTATGSTVRHSSNKIILGTSLYFPSLPEQQKIADCLSSLDDRITTENEKLDTLKTHKKGLMQQLFPAQGETLPKLRFPEFRDAGVWEEKKLGEIAAFHKGKGISKADIDSNGKIPCVRYGELYTHYKEIISSIASKTNLSITELFLGCKNDVIIPSSGETKLDIATASCLTLDGVALGGDINVIRCDQNGIFMSYYLNACKKFEIAKIAQGDTVVHLYSSQLRKLDITLPKLPEQQKIADCLSSLDDRITAENEKLDTLKTHKKGLMQQLFPAEGETLPKKKLEDIAPLQHRTIMTEQNHKQLGTTLWGIADQLRGAMNADDFRDYMLSFLFLRYLSDNYEAAAQKELGSDYPDNNILGLTENSKTTPLQLWYDQNPDDIKEFEKQMRRKAHYVIKPQHLWGNIAEMARTQNKKLLETLQEGLKYIENESFDSNFQGLFSEINLNSEKLGKTLPDRNAKLCTIITAIAEGLNNFSTDSDTLGDAYEYLIGQFASGSGKKAGEFYTPQQISSILSAVVTLDSQDPSTGKKKHLDSVLDFACGSGSLLLNVRHQLGLQGISKIYGQEKNITTYNLARMNMLLHGVKDSEFEIFHGDTLLNQWEMLKEANPAKKPSFDAVVANPPFSYRWEPTEAMSNDVRFKNYGLAPKSAADFAFLLHGFHYLKPEGTMAIVLPHGVLFRGGAEEKIRTKLLKDDNIDTVIGLPANLFYSTGIPVCILVLKKCKKPDDVLFINAAEYFEKGKRQNRLLPEHISKIIDTYQFRRSEERYSRIVPMTEIESNGYNLNISRYISTAMSEEEIDLDAVHSTLLEVEKKIDASTKRHNQFLKELGLPPLP
ncbi:type I restriction-modification system subunit M [Chrysosporum bergii ANA360D]|uniref:site-specific DNA-methyltransferase (adenine-specific) n=1 Tax=Chrysosporum bergii ANA360D TaxID=617107 RepID=A0AA43GPJ8_9CYAN|nr:type I restriction-modification system subunit M [Chrysosporum bergii]MDH6059095.1 type I restriction-modification system subunit M [Chrysosporum bergii ANA360D]